MSPPAGQVGTGSPFYRQANAEARRRRFLRRAQIASVVMAKQSRPPAPATPTGKPAKRGRR